MELQFKEEKRVYYYYSTMRLGLHSGAFYKASCLALFMKSSIRETANNVTHIDDADAAVKAVVIRFKL